MSNKAYVISLVLGSFWLQLGIAEQRVVGVDKLPGVFTKFEQRIELASKRLVVITSPLEKIDEIRERKQMVILKESNSTGVEGFLVIHQDGRLLDFVVGRHPVFQHSGRYIGYLNFVPMRGQNLFGDTLIIYDTDNISGNRFLTKARISDVKPDDYWIPFGEMVGIPVFPTKRFRKSFFAENPDDSELRISAESLCWAQDVLYAIAFSPETKRMFVVSVDTSKFPARPAVTSTNIEEPRLADKVIARMEVFGNQLCVVSPSERTCFKNPVSHE